MTRSPITSTGYSPKRLRSTASTHIAGRLRWTFAYCFGRLSPSSSVRTSQSTEPLVIRDFGAVPTPSGRRWDPLYNRSPSDDQRQRQEAGQPEAQNRSRGPVTATGAGRRARRRQGHETGAVHVDSSQAADADRRSIDP